MITRKIKYVDPITKEEVEEDFYFHFTEMELLRLNNAHKNLQLEMERVNKGLATNKEITDLFEEFVSKSYGERTAEGRFVKSKEITEAFLVSEPYSKLVVSWFQGETGADDAAQFLNSLMPPELVARAEARAAADKTSDQPSAERIEELKARGAQVVADNRREGSNLPPVIDAEIVTDDTTN